MSLQSLLPSHGRVHPVLDSGGQLFGPARDGLRLDAYRSGGAAYATSEQSDSCAFVHGALKHALPANASILYPQAFKIAFMEYGERLKVAIGLADETRDRLAKALGISVQAVGQVITGTTKAFNAENNARAARFLGVSPFWLATGQETPRGMVALRESLSDEAIAHASQYERMTETERTKLRRLMAVATDAERSDYRGGMSDFGDLDETGTG